MVFVRANKSIKDVCREWRMIDDLGSDRNIIKTKKRIVPFPMSVIADSWLFIYIWASLLFFSEYPTPLFGFFKFYLLTAFYKKNIRYFFTKPLWISMKRVCMRRPWTLIHMCKFFTRLSIASVDCKQHLSEVVLVLSSDCHCTPRVRITRLTSHQMVLQRLPPSPSWCCADLWSTGKNHVKAFFFQISRKLAVS